MSEVLNLKYKEMFNRFKKIINSWDPYKLIESGSPEDEYEDETAKILAGLSKCNSVNTVAKLISDVFGESFDKKNFPVKFCVPVGKEIYFWYKNK